MSPSGRESIPSVADLIVADRTSSDLLTVTAEDSCQWALRVMNAANLDRLPVLEGARVVGVVSDRDIYRLATSVLSVQPQEEKAFLAHVHVGGVMTYAPVTIAPTASLREAIATMLEHRINALPVVGDGKLQGILTTTDLLRSALAALGNGSTDGA